MSKTIFIANRLPLSVEREKNNSYHFVRSIGGLATGLRSVHQEEDGKRESVWMGFSGLTMEGSSEDEREELTDVLWKKEHCIPVFLSEWEFHNFYDGFCNQTIWPLFHYFPNQAHHVDAYWEAYCSANEKFYQKLNTIIEPGDLIWVHDYQLLLLPQLIREQHVETSLGFFLHIPFPSYEIIRLIPWRKEIITGMLGADLIGFHTYDYVRHFISSARRILGHDYNNGYLTVGQRLVRADVFPMGIDFKKYHEAGKLPQVKKEIQPLRKDLNNIQMILSVNRLDYTKGIPENIHSFGYFLEHHPLFHGNVCLFLIVAPSRTGVEGYQDLLREIRELVSTINGRYASISWTPIQFFFRSFSFYELAALYRNAAVLLASPLRDGMNLVAKEYLASRKDGVLILSETAGSSFELSEALLVNPNDIRTIGETIAQALITPSAIQIEKNKFMRKRLQRYDVNFWARDFIGKLYEVKNHQQEYTAKNRIENYWKDIYQHYCRAKKRILFLDYDGTLAGFHVWPGNAKLDEELITNIQKLLSQKENTIVIVSGRSREDLGSLFADIPVALAAGHGSWLRTKEGVWETIALISDTWKENIRPILETHTDRTPGSFVEEKDFSLAWHYRMCEPDLATLRLGELKDALYSVAEGLPISVLDGKKVLEVRENSVNKGRAVARWLYATQYDWILGVGDDITDEDMFEALPDEAYSIKVGFQLSHAKYHVENYQAVHKLLKDLAASVPSPDRTS